MNQYTRGLREKIVKIIFFKSGHKISPPEMFRVNALEV